MPLYEYQCESCQKVTERIQKYSDPPLDACPACGGAMKKLLSSPAIQFKGTGWYITDYAKKSSNGSGKSSTDGDGSADASAKSEKPATSDTSSKTESKADTSTKPSAKSDS